MFICLAFNTTIFQDLIRVNKCPGTSITQHRSADSVPTSNLIYVKEVTIRTTFYCWNNLLHL